MLLLPCYLADDTAAILQAIKLASHAAVQLSTQPCGWQAANRCLVRGSGVQSHRACPPASRCTAHTAGCSTQRHAPRPALACRLPALQPPHKGFLNEGKTGTVVWLPEGTYKVTQTLEITYSNVVLRGAGVSWPAAAAATAAAAAG